MSLINGKLKKEISETNSIKEFKRGILRGRFGDAVAKAVTMDDFYSQGFATVPDIDDLRSGYLTKFEPTEV